MMSYALGVETKVRLYAFARVDSSTGRDAETVAIDDVAQSLLSQSREHQKYR